MFKKCIENRITRKPRGYKCYLCHNELLEPSFETVLEHIQDWKHRKCFKQLDNGEKNKMFDEISSISEGQRKIIVENDISIARKKYNFRCYLCHAYMETLTQIYEHIRSFAHQKCFKEKYKKFLVLDNKNLNLEKSKFVEDTKLNLIIDTVITTDIPNLQNTEYIHKNKMFQKTMKKNKSHISYSYSCGVCRIPLISSSLIKCHCMFHLFQKYKLEQADVIHFHFKNNDISINCLLCQVDMSSIQMLDDHLKDSNHITAIESFPAIKRIILPKQINKLLIKKFEINDNFLLIDCTCQVCNTSFTEYDLRRHIDSENHYKNVITQESTKECDKKIKKISKIPLDNFQHYICFICNKSQLTIAKLLQHYECETHRYKLDYLYTILNEEKIKLQEKNSQSKSDSQIENADLTTTEQEIKFIRPGDHTIVFSSSFNNYKCYSCKCPLINMSSIIKHISEESHLRNLKNCWKQSKKVIKTNTENENSSSIKVNSTCENHIFKMTRYCTDCCVNLINDTVFKYHSLLHVYKEFSLPKNTDIVQFDFNDNKKVTIKCLLCDLTMNGEMLLTHVEESSHVQRSNLLNFLKKNSNKSVMSFDAENESDNIECISITGIQVVPFCKLCDKVILNQTIEEHIIEERQHKYPCLDLTIDTMIEMTSPTNLYECFLCKCSYNNKELLLQHFMSENHKLKADCFHTVLNDPHMYIYTAENEGCINCEICFITFSEFHSASGHIQGLRHKECIESNHFQNAINICVNNDRSINKVDEFWNKSAEINEFNKSINHIENIKEKTNHKNKLDEVSTANLDTKLTSINDELNKLVELELSGKQKKKLRRSLKGKSFKAVKTGKNSRFNVNLLNYVDEYLELCIIPGRENIYNTCPEKMNLLHLGAYLSCSYKGTRICIVCQYELLADDEFVLYEHLQSSAHYNTIFELETKQKEFKYYGNQTSDMDLAYEYMVDESDYIQCYVCDVTVLNSIEKIAGHIVSERHFTLSNYTRTQSQIMSEKLHAIYTCSWYYAHLYFCDICHTRHEFEMDFVVHLMSNTHTNSLKKLKEYTNFEVCPICSTCWYGTSDTSNKHYENSFHQHFLKRNQFVLPYLTKATENLLEKGEMYVNNLIEKCSEANHVEQIKESELLKSLEGVTKSIYPNVKAYIFGSRLSKLGMPNSDVDVFLDCEKTYYDFERPKEKSEITLEKVSSLLEKQKDDWIIDEIVYKTRVPIIKTRHVPTNLQCDISCFNGLGVEKSKMLG